MAEVPIQFQVCYFADLSAVEPTAETIASLANEFSGRKLLPTTYSELGPLGHRMRLSLRTADNEWVADLDGHRIDLHKNVTAPGADNLGSLEQFCIDARDIIVRVLKVFSLKGNRLSLVTKAWLRDLSDEALKRAYTRLFNPLPYYEEFPPAAWSSRSVTRVPARLGDRHEIMNVILTTDRAQRRFLFDASQPAFDGIQVEVDVNTFQGNTETRFTAESLPEFLDRAMELRRILLQQLRERLDG
jgi:hypothetical protein